MVPPGRRHDPRKRVATYRGHSKIALEAPADSVVDTLGLAPRSADTHKAVALMAHEALRACKKMTINIRVRGNKPPSLVPETVSGSNDERLWAGLFGQSAGGQGSRDVRFFTIGTCFLAATICATGQNKLVCMIKTTATIWRYFTLAVLLSGDGQLFGVVTIDLPGEKFQNLVELVGLGLCENC